MAFVELKYKTTSPTRISQKIKIINFKMKRFSLFVENCPGLNFTRFSPIVGIILHQEMNAGKGRKCEISLGYFLSIDDKLRFCKYLKVVK